MSFVAAWVVHRGRVPRCTTTSDIHRGFERALDVTYLDVKAGFS